MIAKGELAINLGWLGHDVVGRNELHVSLSGFVQGGLGNVHLVTFHQRLANREALGQLERVSHGAANEYGVGLLKQAVDDLILSDTLAPPRITTNGLAGDSSSSPRNCSSRSINRPAAHWRRGRR